MDKLTEGDEQFDAFRKFHVMTCDLDTESAAYALERFACSYFMDDESLNMSLSLAKQTIKGLDIDRILSEQLNHKDNKQ